MPRFALFAVAAMELQRHEFSSKAGKIIVLIARLEGVDTVTY
jgi:hypothetical protein